MVHICEEICVVLHVDVTNLLGIVKPGSSKLSINELAREFFYLSMRHWIIIYAEWVPREENPLADGTSRMLFPEDSMLSRQFFGFIDENWVRISWTSSRLSQKSITRSSMLCIGAGEVRASMPPDNFGQERIVGAIVIIA
jgi:hypothetical protein